MQLMVEIMNLYRECSRVYDETDMDFRNDGDVWICCVINPIEGDCIVVCNGESDD